MNLINFFTIFLIIIGLLFIIFSSFKGKSFALGLVIILTTLVLRAVLWFASLL